MGPVCVLSAFVEAPLSGRERQIQHPAGVVVCFDHVASFIVNASLLSLWRRIHNAELPLRVRRRLGLEDFATAIRSCDPWSNWKGPTQAALHERSITTCALRATSSYKQLSRVGI